MAEQTAISWTDSTFNPIIGCSKVHTGCTNCYAEREQDTRYKRAKWGPNGTRSKTSDMYWQMPDRLNKAAEAAGVQHKVFCASLADVFEEWEGGILDHKGQVVYVSKDDQELFRSNWNGDLNFRPATMADVRQAAFNIMDATPWLIWQVLTKRPELIERDVPWPKKWGTTVPWRPNVWYGTSVSDQATADDYWARLVDSAGGLTPVLFLSIEPLLGPVDLFKAWRNGPLPQWVIVGGESGPESRPCDIRWINAIVEQCAEAGVPLFVKQFGDNCQANDAIDAADAFPAECVRMSPGYRPGMARVHLKADKGGDPAEWPEWARVQQFPNVTEYVPYAATNAKPVN